MIAVWLVAVGAMSVAQAAQLDTATYRSAATADLVARAQARHLRWETNIGGYSATIHTVMEGRVAPHRFARGMRVLGAETVARITWRYPNDLRVDLAGSRFSVPRLPGVPRDELEGWFSEVVTQEPWFSPSAFGDEIQLMGVPDEAALHPLGRGAHRYYRYAIMDSTILELSTRRVVGVALEVQPKVFGPTLVAGTLWLDADSLDVVRLSATFVGAHLWDDDDEAPELLKVEADLEFALADGRYWLPHRQILSTEWRYRYLPGATMPATAVTTFTDHRIESAEIRYDSRHDPGGAGDSSVIRGSSAVGRTSLPVVPTGPRRKANGRAATGRLRCRRATPWPTMTSARRSLCRFLMRRRWVSAWLSWPEGASNCPRAGLGKAASRWTGSGRSAHSGSTASRARRSVGDWFGEPERRS